MITIKLTEEQILRKVMRHFAKQGGRATVGGSCRYRMSNGKSCAIGCLIPESKYDKAIEGDSIMQLVSQGIIEFPNADKKFIYDLQRSHDDNGNLETLKFALSETNRKHRILPQKEFTGLLSKIRTWK